MSSNGIDFIIGGKDKAGPAFSSAEKGMARLEAGTKALKSATQSLMVSMAPLLAVLAAVKTVMAAVGGVKAANEAYDKQTEAIKRLNAALAIRGQQAASASMQAMAKNLEKLTGVSDQATLALMQTAQSLGFATDKADDAAKAATGLVAATGKTAEESLGDMKAALEGNFEAFHGLNPQIMFMRSNQEKLAAVMAIANQGLQQQSQDMGTVEGSGRRADSAMGSLMESFGKIIAPIRVLINAGIQQLATALDSLLVPIVQYATSILENIGPIMEWVQGKVVAAINVMIGAFTFFEVILTNLGDVWELAKNSAWLALEWMAQEVAHTLIERIPAYAMWFAENFPNLIRDGINLAFTALKNRLQQMADAVAAFFVFIETGGQTDIVGQLGEIAGRSLAEGFKSSLTSLPEIAGRQLSEREKDLADKIGKIGGRLGQEFSDKMEERMLGVGSALGDEVRNATSQISLQGRPAVMMQNVQATEGRLLTRGPGTSVPDKMDRIIQLLEQQAKPKEKPRILVRLDDDQMRVLDAVRENTSNTLQMEAIA